MSMFGDLLSVGGMGAAMAATGGAINPLTAAAIMGGTGMLAAKDRKNDQLDVQKANAQSAAAQTQFSPYTNMGAGKFEAAPTESVMGGALGGAMTGLQLSQNYNKAQAATNMMDRASQGWDQNQLNQTVQQAGMNPYVNSYSSYGSNTRQG